MDKEGVKSSGVRSAIDVRMCAKENMRMLKEHADDDVIQCMHGIVLQRQ